MKTSPQGQYYRNSTKEFTKHYEWKITKLSETQDKYELLQFGETKRNRNPYWTSWPMSNQNFFKMISEKSEKGNYQRRKFIAELRQSRFPTFRFETRPISTQLKGETFEFILVNEPALQSRQADIETFAEHFQRGDTKI